MSDKFYAFNTGRMYCPTNGQRIAYTVVEEDKSDDGSMVYVDRVAFVDADRHISGVLNVVRIGDKIRHDDVLQSYDAGGYDAGLYQFEHLKLEAALKDYAIENAGAPK